MCALKVHFRARPALTPIYSQPDAKYACKAYSHRIYHSPTVTDYAITNKLTPFISMQNHYSLIYREEEREMFPTLKVCRSMLPLCPHQDLTWMTIALWRGLYPVVAARSWSAHAPTQNGDAAL